MPKIASEGFTIVRDITIGLLRTVRTWTKNMEML